MDFLARLFQKYCQDFNLFDVHHPLTLKYEDQKPKIIQKSKHGDVDLIQWSQFKEISLVGEGAYCVVYKAQYKDKVVAIKKVKPDFENKDESRMMLNEARILQKIDHSGVVKLLGLGEEGSSPDFLVLEYIDQTLTEFLKEQRIKNSDDFLLGDAINLGIQLASILAHLHHEALSSNVIIHRDIKPDNIGFTNGQLKLIDFGLSKIKSRVSDEGDRLNPENQIHQVGTPRYMAPEVGLRKYCNHKSDIYSFALVFWQLLTLQTPFEEMDIENHYEQLHQGLRPSLKLIPRKLSFFLSRCWHVVPEKRPDFPDILHFLVTFLNNECDHAVK
mmetsp:Transcript_36225/g.47776  ORF Transcript_36225/g.47776 Transcript_36225/m.47776 type:complete len:330 (-) Transcript_36225:82-1071(-)